MEKIINRTITEIIEQFNIPGKYITSRLQRNGHINETYIVTFEYRNTYTRYVIQQINDNVFKKPVLLMENIQRVTSHIRKKLHQEGTSDVDRKSLELILTKDGEITFQDEQGHYWRVFNYIENSQCYESIEIPEQAFEAGKAFGEFQSKLTDLSPPRLHDTIPDFHNAPKRYLAFEDILQLDPFNRAKNTKLEIEFILKNKSIVDNLSQLQDNYKIPERIAHNDAKVNNVLLDEKTSLGLCVIDLDTVMPGLSLYDFGDLLRTTISKTKEDEVFISKINIDIPLFSELVKGYLSSTHNFLTPVERTLLVSAGELITFEQGIRFLTDYLNGDSYYRISRENQNLDRTRTQLKLVELIDKHKDKLNTIVENISGV